MRLWIKLLIGAVALVLVLVAGAAVFISQIDPNEYRDTITDAVEDATGRKLRIGGDLRMKLLPVPSLEANDVAFANASWSAHPDMARVKRLRADLAVMPLLQGRMEIRRFDAIEPVVYLETDADGKGNWDLAAETPSVAKPEIDGDAQSATPDIVVSEVRVEKAELEYLDGKTGKKTVLHVDELTLGTQGLGGRVTLALRATYQGLPVKLDGTLGAAGAIAKNQPIEIELEGNLGDTGLRVEGAVARPLQGRDMRLDIGLSSPSTKQITDVAGADLEEIGPLELSLKLLEDSGYFDLDDIKLKLRPRDTDASLSGSIKSLALDFDGTGTRDKPAQVDVKGAFGDARFAVAGDVAKPMEGKGLRLNVTFDTKTTRPLTDLAGLDVEEIGPLDLKLTVIEKDNRFDLESIDVQGRPRNAQLAVKGSIKNVIENPRPELDVALSAKTLRQLDKTLPDVGPVSLSAKARPRGKIIEIRALAAKVGKSDLSGSATVDISGDRPVANAKLRSTQIDLKELAPPAEKTDTGTVAEKPVDGKVFSADPLPLDALQKINGNIALAVGRLITPKLTFEKLDAVVKLDNGNLTITPAVQVAGGTVDGTINIDARAKPAKFSADVGAKKVSIGVLTKELRGYETSKGLDSNLKMKLRGQGDSLRALMGGLDGDIRLAIGEGRLNNDVLDRVGADLVTQMLSVAVPTDEEEKTTEFKCAVVRFAVVKGDAIADQTLVMETDKVLVIGGGLIDLKTENMDLGAKLAARKGIRIGAGTLSSLARVQGTLANPQVGTDLTGLAETGARVGIAVATGGLSLLAESVYGRVSEDEQPCETALAREIKVTPAEHKAQSTSEQN